MSRIIRFVILTLLISVVSFTGLLAFSTTLLDDIEIYSGKSTTKKWRKETRFFRKYLFWDYRQHIIWWHYILLWVYIVSCILSVPALILYDIFSGTEFFPVFHRIALIFIFTASLSLGIAVFSRYKLYRGNKVRRRPKKATKSQRNSVKFAKDSENAKKQRN